MDKVFDLKKEPFIKGQQIFAKSEIVIHKGLTVLVGCNGSGKTTMLRQMKKQLDGEGAAVIYYDYADIRENKDQQLQLGNAPLAQFASWVSDSEGEQIIVAMNVLARNIGGFVKKHAGEDIFILIDAVDSGLSIDNIDDVKEYLFSVIIRDVQSHGKHVYIIVTANSYEMAADENCVDAAACEEIKFADYAEYKNFIIKSAGCKSQRDK